jgi:xanthine/uracil permease
MISKRVIFHILALVALFFVEVTIVQLLLPPAVSLRLLLLIGLSLLFLDYLEESFWWMVGGGILLDLHSSQFFGLHTSVFLASYLAVSFFRQRVVHQPNLFLLVGTILSSILIYDLAQWLAIVGEKANWLVFLKILAGDGLVNFIFIWPIYLCCYYLSSWLSFFGLFKREESLKYR